MSNRGTVYVDFDDVLCETARGLALIAKREFGWQGAFRDIRDFDLGVSFNLTDVESTALLDLAHEPEALLSFSPVPGAVEGTKSLATAGLKIAVVTGRPVGTRRQSLDWLRQHDIPFDALIFVDKYGRTSSKDGREDPISLGDLSAMDFCAAIDDAPEMLTFLAERMTASVIVFARPWNAGHLADRHDYGSRITRCETWPEILRILLA